MRVRLSDMRVHCKMIIVEINPLTFKTSRFTNVWSQNETNMSNFTNLKLWVVSLKRFSHMFSESVQSTDGSHCVLQYFTEKMCVSI